MLALFSAEVGGDRPALRLCAEFLGATGYSPRLATRLLRAAAGRTGARWEVRRLAALMLQQQALRLLRRLRRPPFPASRLRELDRLLVLLSLKDPGLDVPLHAAVLAEGYTRRDLPGFARELRRRLERARPVLDPPGGLGATPSSAAADPPGGPAATPATTAAAAAFLALARRECKLALARYLFSPEDVVARILAQVEVSRGVPDPFPADLPFIADQGCRFLAGLPPYEAAILRLLIGSSSRVYWARERTPRTLNALVEYPAGTVVLVVKPPGSELEIEIKRAGRPTGPPLSAVYERGGAPVPPSHRLDGGSFLSALHWDARACSLLAAVHRQVHGGEPPLSQTLALAAVHGVPTPLGEFHLLDYFTDPRHFGAGFPGMRAAMAGVVEAFGRERGTAPPELPGDLGLTTNFLACIPPGQAILAGTSSFRLDQLALYLSERGPAAYFAAAAPGGAITDSGAPESAPELSTTAATAAPEPALLHQLADELLEEILGTNVRPDEPLRPRAALRPAGALRLRGPIRPAPTWPGYPQYLQAAFALPANRARADRVYRDLMRQAGALWGTICALRGFTRGESFVARNVGLKSRWERGRWRVRIVFMDHDNLQLGHDIPQPLELVRGMRTDDLYMMGRPARGIPGSTGLLREIYRVDPETARRGKAGLLRAMARAYRRTLRALRLDPRLAELLPESLRREAGDWEAAVRHYLRRDRSAGGAWKERVRRHLVRRGCYGEQRIENHLQALEEQGAILESLAPLYLAR